MQDCILNALSVRENLIIPKANDPPAALFQPRRSPLVGTVVSMLTAIRLDNEAMRDTHEVDDGRANRTLTAKLVTSPATAPQSSPQTPLGIGHVDP